MCELFAFSSQIPTAVTFSLRAFAQRGGPGGPIDGWGIAIYDGRDVRLYKEPEPARDNAWVSFIESRRVPTQLMLSHLRHATQGGVSYENTQPFVRELGGRLHVFAHNGRLTGLSGESRSNSPRFRPVGDTDSEAAFCVLLDRLAALWEGNVLPESGARFAVVEEFAADLRELGPANFLYCDGDILFAHGHRRTQVGGNIEPPGLWRLHRRCRPDPDAFVASGVSIESCPQDITIFASVPLSDEGWTPLQEGEVIAVRAGCSIGYDDTARTRPKTRVTIARSFAHE